MLKRTFPGFRKTFSRNLTKKHESSFENLISIDEISPDFFRQKSENLFSIGNRSVLFGGQIIGSSILASKQTLFDDFKLHSYHSYFVNAPDKNSDVFYRVQRIRDGKSFQTRRVTVEQRNRIVFDSLMSFNRPESSSIEHQPLPPHEEIPRAEELQSAEDLLKKYLDERPEIKSTVEQELSMPPSIEVRFCDPTEVFHDRKRFPALRRIWVKSRDPMLNSTIFHQSAIAYIADRIILGAAFYPHGFSGFDPRVRIQTSLDFSIYFHDDSPKIDDWILFDIESTVFRNNRMFGLAKIWSKHGRFIGTSTTEGLVRLQ